MGRKPKPGKERCQQLHLVNPTLPKNYLAARFGVSQMTIYKWLKDVESQVEEEERVRRYGK